MLTVILIWLYMFLTVFLTGYGILKTLTRLCTYQVRKWDSYLMCGLAGVTVYAQFFSLFARVGLLANLVLTGTCLVIAICFRKKLLDDIREKLRNMRKGEAAGIVILFFLFAYGTSRGIIHYDTGLYHAQSIRWIEEYGVVKGLGNLHSRLAYNSASFALSALYSFAFLGGASYHAAAGFLALIVAKVCGEVIGFVKRKHWKASDFARIMGIYYLLIIFDEMVSPASDYFMVLTTFYLVICWMDLLEEQEDSIFPYAMLCVLGVFLLTIKFSAALVVLLTWKPAAALIREKRWKESALYLGMGIFTAAPFLIRNVLLSGWFLYPFTGVDFFQVDWKIPEGVAAYDAKEIQVWGRGYHDVLQYDMPIWEWLPSWYRNISGLDKLFVLTASAMVFIYGIRLIDTIWSMCRKEDKNRRKALWMMDYGFKESDMGNRQENMLTESFVRRSGKRQDRLLMEGVLAACFLFWLLSSPLIRYGCVYAYLASAVIGGDMLTELLYMDRRQDGRKESKRYKTYLEKASICAVGFFLAYKAVAFGKELAGSYVNDYWIYQKDYDNYETESYEIDGFTFYCPVTGDQTGYDSFPSSPVQAKIGFRGDGIEDGFYFRGQ